MVRELEVLMQCHHWEGSNAHSHCFLHILNLVAQALTCLMYNKKQDGVDPDEEDKQLFEAVRCASAVEESQLR